MFGLALFSSKNPAFSQAAPQPWQVACAGVANNSKLSCQMSQALVVEQSRQRVLSANLFFDSNGSASLRVQFPHGVDVTKPVVLSVDDGTVAEFPIRYGDASGTYGILPLTSDTIEAMKRGNKLSFVVTAWQGGQLNLELSLTGFTAAYQLMEASKGQ